jgi:hypothetical protein
LVVHGDVEHGVLARFLSEELDALPIPARKLEIRQ